MKEGLSFDSKREVGSEPEFSDRAYHAYASKFYEGNHNAMLKRRALFSMLDKHDFKKEDFMESLNSWNDEEEKVKGFDGEARHVETIKNEHGAFEVYFFPTGAVKFVAKIA